MTTAPKPLSAERAPKLEHWLRRRLRVEGWQQLLEGVIFLGLGCGMLAIPFILVIVVGGIAFGIGPIAGGDPIPITVYLLVAAIVFIGSYLTRKRGDISGERRDAKYLFGYSVEFLFGAPAQFRISIASLEKCSRLWRCDVHRVSVILLWLFDRRRKADIADISASLSDSDSIRILPQLRDISGVIWLTYHHGVVILSEELRREMARVLKEIPRAKIIEENPPEPEPAEAPDSGKKEVFGWYATMNLPPFSPLSAVRKRYRELVKIYHPDAIAGRKSARKITSDDEIKRINAAYHNILENSKRARR